MAHISANSLINSCQKHVEPYPLDSLSASLDLDTQNTNMAPHSYVQLQPPIAITSNNKDPSKITIQDLANRDEDDNSNNDNRNDDDGEKEEEEEEEEEEEDEDNSIVILTRPTLPVQTTCSTPDFSGSSSTPSLKEANNSSIHPYHMLIPKDSIIDPTTLPERAKAWTKPGADLGDYFNYGFNEQSWKDYVRKQVLMRKYLDRAPQKMLEKSEPDKKQPSSNNRRAQNRQERLIRQNDSSIGVNVVAPINKIPNQHFTPNSTTRKPPILKEMHHQTNTPTSPREKDQTRSQRDGSTPRTPQDRNINRNINHNEKNQLPVHQEQYIWKNKHDAVNSHIRSQKSPSNVYHHRNFCVSKDTSDRRSSQSPGRYHPSPSKTDVNNVRQQSPLTNSTRAHASNKPRSKRDRQGSFGTQEISVHADRYRRDDKNSRGGSSSHFDPYYNRNDNPRTRSRSRSHSRGSQRRYASSPGSNIRKKRKM